LLPRSHASRRHVDGASSDLDLTNGPASIGLQHALSEMLEVTPLSRPSAGREIDLALLICGIRSRAVSVLEPAE
jgi:hypothetical protein